MTGATVTIVHVLGSMTAGGNERLCLELIRRAPADVSSVLLTIDPQPNGALTELFQSIPRLRFFQQPYSRQSRVRFVARLAQQLRTLKPDGVVIYPFGLHVLVALALKVAVGCKVIVHVGNPPPPPGRTRTMFSRIVRASRWLNTPLWCCSETVYAQFLRLGLEMPSESRAVPNGIDVDALREAAARGRAARGSTGPIIAMVARLDAIKDHDTLLSAMAQVLRHQPTAVLWLIGTGERQKALMARAAALGIAAAVRFMGVRPNVAELLGQIDLFVFSTTPAEGFGIALAEAMAVGLPIVASDVAACREVLGEGACGVLVPGQNAAALAAAILELLQDEQRRQQLSTLAQMRARREYDIAACARKYYGHLLSPSSDPPLAVTD